MKKEIINCKKAPAPIGPYSQAVSFNGMLFISGQIALDVDTGSLVDGDIKAESEQVMKNLQAILLKSNSGFSHVLKTSIFLSNMDDFAAVNEVYAKFFKDTPPARETIAVSTLPMNVNVEISMIAVIPGTEF